MKRKLSRDEIKFCKASVKAHEKQIESLKEAKEYSEKKLKFLENKWKAEDDGDTEEMEKLIKEWEKYEKPLVREKTRENAKNSIIEKESEIKKSMWTIEQLKSQLKYGVDVKPNSAVK